MTGQPAPVGAVLRIPVDLIDPGPNARGAVGVGGDVTELAASLRHLGQQIPVVVEPATGGRWRLIDGHRRHAAARRAGVPHLDAVIRPTSDAVRRLLAQLAIQAGARRYDPMAESRACHTLMFEHGLTREQIARAVGRTPAWVRDRISLVHLEPDEIRQVETGRLSVAEALLRLRHRRQLRDGRASSRSGRRRRRTARTPKQHALAALRRAAARAVQAGVDRQQIDAAVDAGCRAAAGAQEVGRG